MLPFPIPVQEEENSPPPQSYTDLRLICLLIYLMQQIQPED